MIPLKQVLPMRWIKRRKKEEPKEYFRTMKMRSKMIIFSKIKMIRKMTCSEI